MAKQHSMPGKRLDQTNNSAPTNEAPWQQLMVFNYLLHETIDAIEQERATGEHTPLTQSWQQFIHHLRRKKPKLGACLDHLLREGFLKQGEVQ